MRLSAVTTAACLALGTISLSAKAQVSVMGQPTGAPVVSARAKYEPAGDKVYHGASLPETWDENGLRRQIASYSAAAGKKLSVVTWFASTYENGRIKTWNGNYADSLARVKRLGALSLIKFSTQQDGASTQAKTAASLRQIGLGAWDDYFKNAAEVVRDFKGPVFISIDHEMNGNWYPYSQAYPNSGTNAEEFVVAWRRIVNIFRQNGANNAAFVWSPNVPDVGGVPFYKYYPGDDYTDWIGVSFYSGNDPLAMNTIYRTYAAKKPFFVTEWATAPEKSQYNTRFPGDAAWIKQFFSSLTSLYPRVKAISWFNWNKGDGNYTLTRIPDQTRAYAQDIAAPRYLDQAVISGGGANTLDIPRLDKPAPEFKIREVVPVERARIEPAPLAPRPAVAPPVITAPVVTAPLVTPRRERFKFQVVPTVR